MHIKTLSTLLFLFTFSTLKAQITFSEDVAPVIYNKCGSCHHEGGIGPLSFTNYDDVKKYAGMITMAAVDPKNRFMPPWMADTTYSHFIDERTITSEEAKMIKKWIDAGMPEGNKAAEPEQPLFPKGSQLGRPDLVVSMAESFTHAGNNKDEYRVFVLPTNLTEGHNVSAIEVQPGNPKIAHHIILALDTTEAAEKLDAKSAGYGYAQYAGYGFNPTYINWGGWVPGTKTRFFPEGISNYILPHSKVLLQMHYAPSPVDTKDSTTVNIFYADNTPKRYLRCQVVSPIDIKDGPFYIPANTVKTFHAEVKLTEDYSIISITPHAHWLAKKWEIYAVHPNGDTTHLIQIKDWDFNWQNFFSFENFIKLEKGTIIYCNGTFDNTDKNFRNPNDPIRSVWWGESAKDEMFLCYIAYVPYKTGDEKIEIGGNVDYMNVTTDNAVKKAIVNYSIMDDSAINLKLFDNNGKLVKQLITNKRTTSGQHQSEIDIKTLKPGTYWCKLTTADFTDSKKIVIE